MATIQTSIRLTDGMSPALRSMSKALGIVLNSFESMQRASGKAIDTQSIQTARQELARASSQFDQIEQEINQNTTAQNNFNNSVRNGTSVANGLWSKLKGIAATYIGIKSASGIISLSDEMTTTTARLNMINDGLQTTAELNDKIYQAAMRSRGSLTDTADAVAKLAARAGSIFKTNDETIAFAETLNKMFIIAGASQQEMASATLQLTQALGSGVLRGEEFNAVFESAPNIMQAVADYMNVPIGKLRELAADGKISAKIVKNAMFSAADKINEQFESMPYTWAQVWTTMKNYAINAFRPVLELVGKLTSSKRFIQFANGVANAISKIATFVMNAFNLLAPIIGSIFDGISNIYNFFVNNWSSIAPLVMGIVGAFLAYKAAVVAITVWQGICALATKALSFAKSVLAASTAMATGATFAQTAAQYGLNAALYACPITWIILAIIALIAVIYIVVAVINYFADTSYSATGFICGCFMTLYATVYNVIAYMWNVTASYVEFLANVFKNPIYSIKRLFANLGLAVLGFAKSGASFADMFANALFDSINWAVNKCIDLLNWLISCLPDKAKEFLGINEIGSVKIERGRSVQDLFAGAESKLNSIVADKPDDYWEAPKMEYKDLLDSYKSGYDWGSGVANKIENALSINKLTDSMTDVSKALSGALGSNSTLGDTSSLGNNPALDDINKNTGDIASDTGSLSGKSDEELNLMRDLAERDAINRYTLSNLKINMTNNNKVSSNMDLDKITEYLQRKVYEGVVSTAEGIHI